MGWFCSTQHLLLWHPAHLEHTLLSCCLHLGKQSFELRVLLLQHLDPDVVGLELTLHVLCQVPAACKQNPREPSLLLPVCLVGTPPAPQGKEPAPGREHQHSPGSGSWGFKPCGQRELCHVLVRLCILAQTWMHNTHAGKQVGVVTALHGV